MLGVSWRAFTLGCSAKRLDIVQATASDTIAEDPILTVTYVARHTHPLSAFPETKPRASGLLSRIASYSGSYIIKTID
jgi:hypothetical protein